MNIQQMTQAMGSPTSSGATPPTGGMTLDQMNQIMNGGQSSPDNAAAALGHSNGLLGNLISGAGAVGSALYKAPGQIAEAAKSGVGEIQQGMQSGSGTSLPQEIQAGLQIGSGAADIASSPFAPIMKPIQSGISSLVTKASDFLSNIPGVQKFAMSPAGKTTSGIAQDISYLDNIAGTIAAYGGGAAPAKAGLTKAGETLTTSGEKSALLNRDSFIRDLVTPEQTVKTATKEIAQGRVQEGGLMFKGRQVEPTTQGQSVMDTIKSIPSVKPYNTVLKNVNAIHDAIGSTAENLRTQLKNSGVIFPKQEAVAFIDKAKSELAANPLLVGDAEKTATKILDKFQQLMDENPGTPEGILDARQGLDKWIKSQKGESVFDPSRESAVSVALRTVRQGANEFLASKTPDIPTKELLSKQTDMYNAIEAMAPKAAKEAETKIGRLIQRAGNTVGVKNKIVQDIGAAVGLAGFGAAAYFAPAAAGLMGVGGLGYGLFKAATSPALRKGAGAVLKGAAKAIPTP